MSGTMPVLLAGNGMKLKLPITFSQCMWALALMGLLIVGVAAGLEHLLHIPLLTKTFIGICITGAVIGAAIQFGILRIFLKCPICGLTGELTFGYQQGFPRPRPLFECPECKRLVNKSRLTFKLGQEEEGACPECGYEFKTGERVCPHCPKRRETIDK